MVALVEKYAKLGWTPDQVGSMAYAMAEQLHQKSCALRGSYNHPENKADQDVAIEMLSSLFDSGFYLERVPEWIV